jgi:predicted membrane-bound dolichyl-phosphate-mannose-protein mannosyltransferase
MKTGRKRGGNKKVRCPPYARRIIHSITRLNKKQIICAEIVLILTLAFAYTSFKTAQEAQGSMGYVSDEKWYVCSARNILREVFGVQPSYVDSWGLRHYTIFFSSSSDFNDVRENFRNFIRTEFEGDITYTYDKTAGVSIATQKELNYENVSRNFPQIIIIQSGYNYHPDTDSGLENSLNPEHPPLVKYIIGLSMLTLGDQPINWRIPGIIAGSLTVLLVYLIVAKLINNKFIALPVYLFAFTDPVMKAMSSIAMLDIYAAFFVTLSAWLALRRNYFLSAISVGLAASCKLNGLFAAPALFLLMVIQHKPPLSGTRKTKLVQFAKRLINPRLYIYALIIPIFIIFIFDIPFTARFGWGWLTNNFPGNIHWFLTSKEGGSAPWGWFVNQNAFAMNFNPDIVASVNSATYFASVIGLAFIPYLAYKVKRDYLVPGFWFSFTFLGFVSVYLLGNRSLHSFYAVALSPMVYVLAFVFVYYFIYFIKDIRRNLGLVHLRLRNLRIKRLRFKRFITRPHRAPKKRKPKKKRKLRSIK